ncbi:hypothetical protein, partial [Faecalibaculum rodentium]|uniref:hypothetical protein n=1 Tax=Faecalibaculum rodentium TaxID=1702221 RepID=UPI0025A520F3
PDSSIALLLALFMRDKPLTELGSLSRFVNAGFRDDSFPGHLMQNLNETDPENITIPLLQDMVKTIKRKKGAEAI